MTFDPSVGLGSLILLVVTLFGGTGVWWTLKNRMDELWERAKSGASQRDDDQKRFKDIELQIARDCVKVDDFRRLEDRMNTKFEKVEHAIGNSALKTVQNIKDSLPEALRSAMRDVLPARGTRE